MKVIKDYILNSPLLQCAIDVTLTVLVGLFSGIFTIEITLEGILVWEHFFKSWSFYVILLLGTLLVIYKRLMMASVNEIERFKDEAYCIAYARSQMLPEAAKKAVEKIKVGKGGEFHDAMEEIKKVLK